MNPTNENAVNERLERMIVRRLDGEITDLENAELARELLRNRAAREMLASYAAIDELAADVLRDTTTRRQPRLLAPAVAHARHTRRNWWMLAGSALAACLALVVFLNTPDPAAKRTDATASSPPAGGNQLASAPRPARFDDIPQIESPNRSLGTLRPLDAGVWQVVNRPPAGIDRTTDRNLLLVTDQQGNVYLLNVDLIRELERGDSTDPIAPDPI